MLACAQQGSVRRGMRAGPPTGGGTVLRLPPLWSTPHFSLFTGAGEDAPEIQDMCMRNVEGHCLRFVRHVQWPCSAAGWRRPRQRQRPRAGSSTHERKRWSWAPASGLLRAPNSKGLVRPSDRLPVAKPVAKPVVGVNFDASLSSTVIYDATTGYVSQWKDSTGSSALTVAAPNALGPSVRPSGRPQWPRKCVGAAPPSAFYAHHNRTGWSRRRCPKTVPPWGCCVPWV